MSTDAKITPEVKDTIDISNILYFDMYLYSIASMRKKNSINMFFNFLAKKNATYLQKLHTVLGIIERYRAWKDNPQYLKDENSIDFYKMSEAIASDLIRSDIVLYQDPEGQSLPITIPMEIVQLGFIKYIITKISEWEATGDPFMQDEQEDTEKTLLE